MSNLFDKQRFLDDLMNCSESIGRKSLMVMIEVLKNQPAIEAEPVVHGEWIVKGQDVFCSYCNNESGYNAFGASVFSPRCPNCGAKMIGGIDHDSGKSN